MLAYANEDSTVIRLVIRIVGASVSVVLAIFVTLALLYLEQFLIESGNDALGDSTSVQLTDIVRMKEDIQLEIRKRKPEPPPIPDDLPEPIPTPNFEVTVDQTLWSFTTPDNTVTPAIIPGSGFSLSDGNYLPLVKVQPIYPRRALVLGLAG